MWKILRRWQGKPTNVQWVKNMSTKSRMSKIKKMKIVKNANNKIKMWWQHITLASLMLSNTSNIWHIRQTKCQKYSKIKLSNALKMRKMWWTPKFENVRTSKFEKCGDVKKANYHECQTWNNAREVKKWRVLQIHR